MPAACSNAGISRLQMEAATMTPAAKPERARWIRSLKVPFIKKRRQKPGRFRLSETSSQAIIVSSLFYSPSSIIVLLGQTYTLGYSVRP